MRRFELLADQIFVEKPARRQEQAFETSTQTHRYVQSRVFSGSRGLHPDNRTPPKRLPDNAITRQLLHLERLGPYERQLLAALLHAPHPMVIIAGSTGCGKSSTLRYILEFYDENARLNQVNVEQRFIPKHVYVDFNKLYLEYSNAEDAAKGTGLPLIYDKLPARLHRAILSSLTEIARHRRVPNKQVLLELVRDAFAWNNMEEDVPGGMSFECPELLDIPAPVLTGNPDQDLEVLLARLRELARSPERVHTPLVFWCAVLNVLAIKSAPTGKRTFLLLDNIDPLPDEVQATLLKLFVSLSINAHFKIILPLRHSRVGLHRQRLKHALECSWYPHCGPNPSEVINSRLLGFIAQPDAYSAFTTLSAIEKEQVLHRALELLLRLMRGTPHYRALGQLAVAGAGDSVRRALEPIRYMFENEDFSFDYMDTKAKGAITQLALELQTLACSGSIGLALREELIGIAMECHDGVPTDEIVDTWSTRLCSTISTVLTAGFDANSSWSQDRVDKLWAHAEIQGMVIEDIETASRLLHRRLVSMLSEQDAREVCGTRSYFIMESIAGGLFEKLRNLASGARQLNGFATFCSVICTTIRRVPSAIQGNVDTVNDLFFSWDTLQICAQTLSRNRSHAMARSLIRKGFLHNLFCIDDQKRSLLPLTLLYYIASHDKGEAPLRSILNHLLPQCSEKGTLHLINDLCSSKSRVIWINHEFVHASYAELKELADADARVTLTQGGWAYYLSILDEVDYVMQGLLDSNIASHTSELLSVRLDVVLSGLQEMLVMPVPQRRKYDPMWCAVQSSVVADLVIRCTRGLSNAVRGHFARMQQDNVRMPKDARMLESRNTRRVAVCWAKLLDSSRERACAGELTTVPLLADKNWNLVPLARTGDFRGLGPISGTGQARWADARATLEKLLRGGELWAPYLDADEFHSSDESRSDRDKGNPQVEREHPDLTSSGADASVASPIATAP